MKKITQLAVALFVVAVAFTSCKNCETCTVFDANGTSVSVYEEYCEKNEKDAARSVASLQAAGINGSFTCE